MVIMSVKTTALLGVAVLVVAIGAVVAVIVYPMQKSVTYAADVVAIVGSHTIKISEIQPYLDHKLARADVLNCVMENYLYSDMAAKYKVSVGSDTVLQQLKADGASDDSYNSAFQKICIRRDLLQAAVEKAIYESYVGQMVLTHFDQNIPVKISADGITMPAIADKTLIAANRADAQALISTLHDQVSKGTLTMVQAAAEEQASPTLGAQALQTSPHSGPFDTSNHTLFTTQLINHSSALGAALARLKIGQVSDIMTLKVATDPSDNPTTTDGIFAFISIDTSTKSAGGDIGEIIKRQKLLGYKVINQ